MSQLTNTSELFERSRTGSSDQRVGTLTREFLVPIKREDAWSYPGVPQPGSTYVANGRTLVCDRLDVEGTPNPDISKVIAVYSNDGRFRFNPKQDVAEVGYVRWSMSTGIQTRKVPSFVLRKVPVPAPLNPNVPFTFIWDRDDLSVEVSVSTYMSTVVLPTYTNDTINTILVQVGLLHRFGTFNQGRDQPYQGLWKFKGHRASRIASDRFEVTYEWNADHGNRGFSAGDGGDIGGGLALIGDTRLVTTLDRGQFEEYLILPPASGQPEDAPSVITYDPYQNLMQTETLNSYRDLPGNPIS